VLGLSHLFHVVVDLHFELVNIKTPDHFSSLSRS
jgi:hypothetical protein